MDEQMEWVEAPPIDRREWRWFGNAGHFICGHMCRFHLCTLVGPWLVSTVGQMWPSRTSCEVHAEIHDAEWFAKNRHRRGDDFDAAYMERFGYYEIGYGRTFETMVFAAGTPCVDEDCACGLPTISGSELEANGYKKAGEATDGHYAMCERWAARTVAPRVEVPR